MLYDPSLISAAGRIFLACSICAVLYALWSFSGAIWFLIKITAVKWIVERRQIKRIQRIIREEL